MGTAMNMKMNVDKKMEWLKNLVSAYEQEQKEVEKKLRDEAKLKERRIKERQEKFKEIYSETIYPILRSYHENLLSVYHELDLSSSDLDELEMNELKINDSYIRFSLNDDEYLPPIEMEVRIRSDIPKVEWLQFKQITGEFIEKKCDGFIRNAFQIVA